jgi:hypothetical protein
MNSKQLRVVCGLLGLGFIALGGMDNRGYKKRCLERWKKEEESNKKVALSHDVSFYEQNRKEAAIELPQGEDLLIDISSQKSVQQKTLVNDLKLKNREIIVGFYKEIAEKDVKFEAGQS